MKKIAVVYWTGSGNTEAMANAVAEGVRNSGSDAELIFCAYFRPEQVAGYDAIAFGCPSMGKEVLEELDFEPMWQRVRGELEGKPIALFGSYGWGDGEWMRNWEADAAECGAVLASPSVIAQRAPDAEAVADCEALGAALAQ